MAQHDRLSVLNSIFDVGIVPVFYHKNSETTIRIIECCAEGGARCVEFTNRGDMAYHVFTDAISHVLDKDIDVILGVGSICDAPTAALYIANGANFVVGPLLNEEVARLCNRRKIAYSPGCGSVTEIGKAEELGVEIVKVFPGSEVGGPAFVKSVLGPCPWTRIMPTGGVDATKESLASWIHSGVAAVGAGSKLITKDLVDAKDWDGLTRKIAQSVKWVKEIREEMK